MLLAPEILQKIGVLNQEVEKALMELTLALFLALMAQKIYPLFLIRDNYTLNEVMKKL